VVLTHLPLVLLVVAGVLVFKATRRRGCASGARSWQHDPYRSGSRHW
jgi:cytochrome c-type biogenesis protein CcmH/NrfF